MDLSRKTVVRSIVFVGHVDAGKSTVCGRLLVDLNLIEERILEKYKKEAQECNRGSWYLSWCMDLNPEEREKGKTQEMSMCSFYLPTFGADNVKINIIDSPGHKSFIGEMIEGASRADIGILIVSARAGEFEAGFKKGQTKEHIRLLRAANVNRIVVLVNKMDECNWNKDIYGNIVAKLGKFISPLYRDVKYIPVSGYTGDNIVNSKTLEWYSEETFVKTLYNVCVESRKCETGGLISIVVERSKGSVISYYVKIEEGRIEKGKTYSLISGKGVNSIIVVDVKDDEDCDVFETQINDVYKIVVSGYKDEISTGSLIVSREFEDRFCAVKKITTVLGIYKEVAKCISIGYKGIMHINGVQTECRIHIMYTSEKKKIKVAKKGEKTIVVFDLEDEVILPTNPSKEGRIKFSLRDEDITVGVGEIIKGK